MPGVTLPPALHPQSGRPSINRANSMCEGKDKDRLAAQLRERERQAAERLPSENPNPQKAPGAGPRARPGGVEADNPVLLE